MNTRRISRPVKVADKIIGGAAPILVQSMTNTDTEDASSTAEQVAALARAGSEIVRITVNTLEAARQVPVIRNRLVQMGVQVPLVGDFHFNGHKLLAQVPDCAEVLDKYRINPGNVGHGSKRDEQFSTMVEKAIEYGKPVRIGVNWGSLDPELLARMMDANGKLAQPKEADEVMREALIVSALESARFAEDIGLSGDRIVISCKVSNVQDLIRVYRDLGARCDYALHLGLTEAGMGSKGIVASTAAMGVLLQEGIGDTIRVSLTPEPNGDRTREVIVAQEILQTMGLRSFTPMVSACPGCGRTTSTFFQELAEKIQGYLRDQMPVWKSQYPGVEEMHVAVMGCVVNGPGESKLANIGISLPGSGEKPVAPVFVDGEKTVTLKGERIAEEFQAIVEQYVKDKYGSGLAPRASRLKSIPIRDMTTKLQAIRGMEDVLPDASPLWERFEDACRTIFRQYGYRNIRTPVVEPTALFVRGIGEATDIVEKEMYAFDDRNGESIALRPEATAGIVRAAIEHNFLYNGPMRVWTAGPMFRYERPQKGRQRQFHQFDVEALGFAGPDVDAEQIVMLARLWKELGITGAELHVNSIGDAADRKAHRAKLIAHFEKHADVLDEDAKRRLHTNPLRILDNTKTPAMQEMIEAAPRLLDHLGDAAAEHFEALKVLLDASGVRYTVNPRLVRGLDYYNRTVFEWTTPNIGAQATIAGGGRYDALFEQLGGKATPACGFGMGMERVLLTMQACDIQAFDEPDVFLVHSGEGAELVAWKLAEQWRDSGRRVVMGSGGSFKSQMKKADASGARFAVIIGEEEVASRRVTLKPLRGAGEQKTLAPGEALTEMS